MELTTHAGGAKALLENEPPDGAVGIAWLGQAGFLLRHAGCRIVIDPYLSDYLAQKYATKEFPHQRMMPPPVAAENLRHLDFVLCSHRHGDHMDPGTLPTLAGNNPNCQFVIPRAESDAAIELGLPESQLIPVNDGEALRLDPSIELSVIASAHETLQVNAKGEHHFLGFILRLGGATVYHSGDCVVYEGLAKRLEPLRIDLALLPVNGRSERLSSRGIVGNMNFDEAAQLCLDAGIGLMIPHHFGMFDFNTVDPAALRAKSALVNASELRCVIPEAGQYYILA